MAKIGFLLLVFYIYYIHKNSNLYHIWPNFNAFYWALASGVTLCLLLWFSTMWRIPRSKSSKLLTIPRWKIISLFLLVTVSHFTSSLMDESLHFSPYLPPHSSLLRHSQIFSNFHCCFQSNSLPYVTLLCD